MRQLNMYSAIKRYNAIMGAIGYEHNEIGTEFSDKTENWNLRDMVAECDYILGTYYENGHCNADMRTSFDEEERKMWRSEVGKLQRFIASYEPFARDMVCTQGHCSQYDNSVKEVNRMNDFTGEAVYTVRIKETMQRDIRIKAKSEEDAIEKISELYYEQEIILNADDLLDEENDRFDCISNDDDFNDYEYSCDDEYDEDPEESRGR